MFTKIYTVAIKKFRKGHIFARERGKDTHILSEGLCGKLFVINETNEKGGKEFKTKSN